MTLALARCLEDPQRLWDELQGHWREGRLVGLARSEERAALRRAVLGTGGAGTGAIAERGAAAAGEGGPGSRPTSREDPTAEHRQEENPAGGPWAAAIAGPGWTWEPAVVVGSGGSSGGRHWCLQPLAQLRASATACGAWLMEQGLDPGRCLHLDALPLHHVSGLMPLVRAMEWGAELRWLPPGLLRRPAELETACPLPCGRPVLLSLVPTQLHRLLQDEEAVRWLRSCSVIWIGGAALEGDLADRARRAGLPLAPCYGATETAAMVCALPPQRFLAGEGGCGAPLADVQLRLEGRAGAIAVRTERISPGWFDAGRLQPFRDACGWWRSGDAGAWIRGRWTGSDGVVGPAAGGAPAARDWAAAGSATGASRDGAASRASVAGRSLVILGRLDGAIHSGGETVFPEQVRQRLLELIRQQELPVAELLVLGEPDALWGERLVALVRWQTALGSGASPAVNSDPCGPPQTPWLVRLADLAGALPPPQRPRRWLSCPELEANLTGKWEQQRWRDWLKTHDATA